jgi:hypothetical protein
VPGSRSSVPPARSVRRCAVSWIVGTFPLEGDPVFLASERSAGKRLPWRDGEVEVRAITPEAFDGVDIALFSAGGARSKEWAPIAAERGAVVIDNSSAFRRGRGRPPGRLGGEPRGRDLAPAPRHRREPELHHDGAHGGGQAPARRLRADRHGRDQLPGGRWAGRTGIEELLDQARRCSSAPSGWWATAPPWRPAWRRRPSRRRSPSTCWPTAAPSPTPLHRRGVEARPRVAQDPRSAGAARVADVCAGARGRRACDRGAVDLRRAGRA